MSTPALSLSTYRAAARSLGAKSAGSLAVAVAALATASTAHATIVVYTPTGQNVADPSANGLIYLNFFPSPGDPSNGNGYGSGNFGAMNLAITPNNTGMDDGFIMNLSLHYYHFNGRYYQGAFLSQNIDTTDFPIKLAGGDPIDGTTFAGQGSNKVYLNPNFSEAATAFPTPHWAVDWSNQTGYIGVNLFKQNNAAYYGWIKLTVNTDVSQVTLDAFAYNDVAGAGITAGEGLAPVPEPAVSATLLALGAAGLVAYRRRKSLTRPTA